MDPISVPSPDVLREKAAEIVARPDYHLGTQADDQGQRALLLAIIEGIHRVIQWIFSLTEGLPEFVRWPIVAVLLILMLSLIAHIIYTLLSAIRSPKRIRPAGLKPRQKGIDPTELERMAQEFAERMDYIAAIRLLFRACVVRLEAREKKSNRPGTTNRELLRRYRSRPELREPLAQFVEMIDRKWYGSETCSQIDYNICVHAHRTVCDAIGEPTHALGA